MPAINDPARPFTLADLDEAPDDGRRWELIAGSLVVTPAPFGRHQLAVRRLTDALGRAEPPELLALPAPYDWRVSDTGESFQPDILVVHRSDFDPDGPLRATPVLVIEVVSPRGKDQDHTVKRARYEALGVPSYWIIDPAVPSVIQLRLSDQGGYVERAVATGDASFTTEIPFPVEFTPLSLTS